MTEVFGIFLPFLKMAMCLVLGTWLAVRMPGIYGLLGILVAWLFLQAAQLAGMYFLSAFDWLAPSPYRLWVALQCVLIFGFLAKRSESLQRRSFGNFAFNFANTTALVFIIGISCLLFIRAIFFYDGTFDALMYGLPRIAYFFQHHSVFAHEPGVVSRMFCNEWNAELNALHYGLLMGSDAGFMLAGVEVWWLALLATTTLGASMGAVPSQALWVGLAIATTPAIFNLSGVTKGDLLAMVAAVSAIAALLEATRMNKAYPGVLLAGLFLAFGAGCKGTLVPVFALFFLCFGIWMLFFKHWSDVIPNFWSLFFCILICIVFLGRHAANLFVFGNPLQRVPLEAETGFDVANILPAITNQFRYMVGVSPDKPWLMGFRFAETRDFAATGWLLSLSLLAITIWVVRHPYTIGQVKFMKHWRGEISAPFLGFTLGLPVVWIYLSGMMPILKFPDWANFQLRFFLWYLVPMAVCVFVFMLSSLKGKKEILWLIGMIVAVFLNLRFGFQPSDVFYSESGLSNFRAWIHRSDFDKKLAGPHFIKNDLGPLQIKAGDPQKILLVMFSGPYAQYNGNPPIFPFFGQDLEWTVDFAGTGAQFKEKLKAGNYDWVVFSQDRDAPLQENLDEELEGTDYERMHAGRWAQIYGKRNECP